MLSLIRFSAKWCGPCKAMVPIMAQIADVYGDKVHQTISDIDDNPQARKDHHIMSIPTFVVFKDGIEISRKIGSTTFSEMNEWLADLLKINAVAIVPGPSEVPGSAKIIVERNLEQGNIQPDVLPE